MNGFFVGVVMTLLVESVVLIFVRGWLRRKIDEYNRVEVCKGE